MSFLDLPPVRLNVVTVPGHDMQNEMCRCCLLVMDNAHIAGTLSQQT